MNKNKSILITFLTFFLVTSCSFDNKTGFWKGSKDEKERAADIERKQKDYIDTVKVYSSENTFSEEIEASKNTILSKPTTNSSWKMPGLNLQNFIGNLYLPNIDNNFLSISNT